MMKKIIQLLPTITFGDAVGNDALAIDSILREKKIDTCIYAENIDLKLKGKNIKNVSEIEEISNSDIIIYHLSTGTILNEWIKKKECIKIMIYHNITPATFFSNYNKNYYNLCEQGYRQVEKLKRTFDIVFADSSYNKQMLIKMGYECPIKVVPIIIPFSDYEKKPNKTVLEKYNDDYINILFVGRVAPNKKQEDLIAAFDCYQKNYNKKSRLFIVGSSSGMNNYEFRLKKYVERLNAKNIIFTGHTAFDEILAYYKIADLFLCMSEHEGFCVPLVESMFFGVPIVAFNSTAIGETLGGSGFLLTNKRPIETAGIINRIITDENLRMKIINNEKERLQVFQYSKVKEQFLDNIIYFLREKNE